MNFNGWKAKSCVAVIRVLVFICDIISFPVYFILHQPWRKWRQGKIVWSQLEDPRDPYGCFVRQVQPDSRPKESHSNVATMDQLFRSAVQQFGEARCYGVREVLSEEEETVKSGKVFKKLILGDYKWISYNEADQRVEDISKGLLALGVQSKSPIVIFAETRIEWMLTAQACFRINVPIVTLYATLGEDGLVHSINETEVKFIVTSSDLIPKLKNILPNTPNVSQIVYMEDRAKVNTDGIREDIKVVPFSEMEAKGKHFQEASFIPPSPDDLIILMYTSGSTGIPKGVMLTHKNVRTSLHGLNTVFNNNSCMSLREGDRYIAYLPSAHILELAAESYVSSVGVQVGFSSPQTLTDFSTAIKRGEKGDLSVLKPTVMVSVPLMLDRIRNSILHLAGREGSFTRKMFDFAVAYKTFWSKRGFRTPFLDRHVLKTYRDFMGGELRYMVTGGAPLSPDTQDFIRSCLSVRLIQGYGLTETTCCNTVADFNDNSSGTIGAPLFICKVRLVDWKEGNYHVRDKPNPRGEIVVGGDVLSLGYYKNSEQTMEAFKIEGGDRWFYTGDIGEVLPNGLFKIIDRKKDLVKLQFGEYVALGRVESELKTSPLVDNICAIGNSSHSYIVALLIPNQFHLGGLAKEIGKGHLTFPEMCLDPDVEAEVTKRIREHGQKCRLFGSELPRKVKLCNDDWTPESGLVTAAFKLRRKYVENRYQSVIDTLYAEDKQNGRQ